MHNLRHQLRCPALKKKVKYTKLFLFSGTEQPNKSSVKQHALIKTETVTQPAVHPLSRQWPPCSEDKSKQRWINIMQESKTGGRLLFPFLMCINKSTGNAVISLTLVMPLSLLISVTNRKVSRGVLDKSTGLKVCYVEGMHVGRESNILFMFFSFTSDIVQLSLWFFCPQIFLLEG